jgi:hypothetical protein
MAKYLFSTYFLLIIATIACAQSKDEKNYKERASDVKQEIWGVANKDFDVTAIPDKYKNASAVIIARSLEVNAFSRRKFKMISIVGGFVLQYTYFTTIRERVAINDKSSLDKFSYLNYDKIIDKSTRSWVVKFKDISKTYLGVKVIKSSGKTITINPDEEEVLTKNSDKSKEGRLAIPDLQVGDIIDYYIRTEEVMEFAPEDRGPNKYFLGDEYPILYYNVKYMVDRRCGADYMAFNGAKPMTVITNNDKETTLEFTATDLPAYNATFWTVPLRQLPYYVITTSFTAPVVKGKTPVTEGPFTEAYRTVLKERYISIILSGLIDFVPVKEMETYYGGKKNLKNLPTDSIVNYLHNYAHWDQYPRFWQNLDVGNHHNNESMKWFNLAVSYSENLRSHEIANDIFVVCNRNSGKLSQVFGVGDFETFIRVNGNGSLKWICFNDFFQTPGQLAADYQGEEAFILTRDNNKKRIKFTYADSSFKLPVINHEENALKETLKVNFDRNNLQTITVERACIETGAMKQADQKKLLLAEEMRAGFAGLIGKKGPRDFFAELKDPKEAKKGLEILAALDNEKIKQKDYFIDEIKEQYAQEPKELINYKIINAGLSVYKPAFEFNETFTMDNFVKKAGNNFIFEAGKLMGSYKRVEDKQRTRLLDIYMPCARTIIQSFEILIPEGYLVKGIEELNKKVETDIASLICTASLEGNKIIVKATRVYYNNFEPASNWPKLLTVMDAVADFTTAKLLLEKRN